MIEVPTVQTRIESKLFLLDFPNRLAKVPSDHDNLYMNIMFISAKSLSNEIQVRFLRALLSQVLSCRLVILLVIVNSMARKNVGVLKIMYLHQSPRSLYSTRFEV